MILHSYAKLNLYLKVGARRKDQYHNLETIFERIDLCDKIVLKPRFDNQIKMVTDSDQIPCDASNLAWRAAALIKDTFKINQGVEIKIIKRIPVASGMGGGSSNAASVLTGLSKFWKLDLAPKRLMRLARQLGADVPFFVSDSPFAIGRKRGDAIFPLRGLGSVRFWHILVVPKIQVSTGSVYQKWDALAQRARFAPPWAGNQLRKKTRARLTRPLSSAKILTSALKRSDSPVINRALFNNLEQASLKLYPEIGRVKRKLSSLGVKSILMSGSGPAVFGIVSSRKEALSLARQLKGNRFWQVYVTRTI